MMLRLEQSWWSCGGLDFPEEAWLERIAGAGFAAVHRRVPEADWLRRCRSLGLRWSATAIGSTLRGATTGKGTPGRRGTLASGLVGSFGGSGTSAPSWPPPSAGGSGAGADVVGGAGSVAGSVCAPAIAEVLNARDSVSPTTSATRRRSKAVRAVDPLLMNDLLPVPAGRRMVDAGLWTVQGRPSWPQSRVGHPTHDRTPAPAGVLKRAGEENRTPVFSLGS